MAWTPWCHWNSAGILSAEADWWHWREDCCHLSWNFPSPASPVIVTRRWQSAHSRSADGNWKYKGLVRWDQSESSPPLTYQTLHLYEVWLLHVGSASWLRILITEQSEILITEGGARLGSGPASPLPTVPHQVEEDQAEEQQRQTCSCSGYFIKKIFCWESWKHNLNVIEWHPSLPNFVLNNI